MSKVTKEEPKYYTNKKHYINNYNKQKCKCYSVRFHKEHDKDIIDFLETIENKQGLFKDLLRKEMADRNNQ